MPELEDLEVGVMFWAGGDPVQTIQEMKALGVRCGQLGVPGEMELEGAADAWKAALTQEDFTVVTVFASYAGESYADVPTVQRTVGFIPPATRQEREQRTKDVIHFAHAIGVGSFACHIGFVPEDHTHPDYVEVREMVRRIADHAARHHLTFALETGQEPAKVLMDFLEDVGKPNVGINFDPANMILYGTGNPLEALQVLRPKLLSVHVKDGDWPARENPDALGVEKPLGQGAVDIPAYVNLLKQTQFHGPLNVEREAEDRAAKMRDMRMGVELLKSLRQ